MVLCLASPEKILASACCVGGGGAKSFLNLEELESYELGISYSFSDSFGLFDPYGDLYETNVNQMMAVSMGGAFRIAQNWDVYFVLPWVNQLSQYPGEIYTSNALGDVYGGVRTTLLRSLFYNDWYPTIMAYASLKFPSGQLERFLPNGSLYLGTGDGTYAPTVGVNLSKEILPWLFYFTASYTPHFLATLPAPTGGIMQYLKGDIYDITESLAYVASRRLSASLGFEQTWSTEAYVNGVIQPLSSTRVGSAFVAGTYFLSRLCSLILGVSAAIPYSGFGENLLATRAITLTTKYGFF